MAVGFQKISVNLSDEVLGVLRQMARKDAVTMTEVLRRAISTHKFVEDAQRDGKTVLIRDSKTNETQVVHFR